MVLLDKMWDDVLAGPPPERGLGKLRKVSTKPSNLKEGESSGVMYQRSMSMPQTPTTPTSATAHTPRHDVWRSVFNPGSNAATKALGADLFDKPQPNSPTVYDWLYSGETKSTHR
ncbi:auxin-repressed 12.5 kDa [Musa troglodytarum]|uniref:Auxin-repressed 12.5 kDa n=1 Tax=Musa troglodytarum TaxID=320322 RepID=A0A9E7GQ50_9LILI|nr:auxin-repressed 12.5 kDa [Musa troglodytarum]